MLDDFDCQIQCEEMWNASLYEAYYELMMDESNQYEEENYNYN